MRASVSTIVQGSSPACPPFGPGSCRPEDLTVDHRIEVPWAFPLLRVGSREVSWKVRDPNSGSRTPCKPSWARPSSIVSGLDGPPGGRLAATPGRESACWRQPDLWTFSQDDANCKQHKLNSVDQTIVAEANSRLIDFVHTKFSNTTKLLTNALKLGKMFMKSVICMASDALCGESTKDAKNTTNLFRDFMPLSLSGRRTWPSVCRHWWCIRNRTSARVLFHT